jgi:acyl carrier protein
LNSTLVIHRSFVIPDAWNHKFETIEEGKLKQMPDYKNILLVLIETLKPLVPQGQEINEDTDLVADLGLDSLKVMKIIESVEDRYDISIPLNVLPEVRTVKDFALQIQKIIGDG